MNQQMLELGLTAEEETRGKGGPQEEEESPQGTHGGERDPNFRTSARSLEGLDTS